MRILITNDDGIRAPGLEVMLEIATELAGPDGEAWTVAPEAEQSGVGHAISFVNPMEDDEKNKSTKQNTDDGNQAVDFVVIIATLLFLCMGTNIVIIITQQHQHARHHLNLKCTQSNFVC